MDNAISTIASANNNDDDDLGSASPKEEKRTPGRKLIRITSKSGEMTFGKLLTSPLPMVSTVHPVIFFTGNTFFFSFFHENTEIANFMNRFVVDYYL